jgi:hypothetical protein
VKKLREPFERAPEEVVIALVFESTVEHCRLCLFG